MVYRLFALLLFVFVPLCSFAQNYLSGYPFRNAITIQGEQVPAPAQDFPVLIAVEGDDFDQNLKGYARADGFDIVFTSSDGFTRLDHELQFYDEEAGRLLAWVKVDLSGSDQIIYMYYGRPYITEDPSTVNVWSNGYRAVWHLEEYPSGDGLQAIQDASAFNNTVRRMAP